MLLHDGENAASNGQCRGKLVEDKVPAQVIEGKKKTKQKTNKQTKKTHKKQAIQTKSPSDNR